MEIYPWQKDAWQFCCRRIEQDRMPHALLLHAAAGFGLEKFAGQLAQMCLCQAQAGETRPCGRCAACRLFSKGNHPDFVLLEGEGAKGSIKIESIRQLAEFMHNSSHLGSYRIILVKEAEKMTTQAANSLLKSLEEPPAKCLFFLMTYWPSRLLPTIRSRCQTVRLATPLYEQTLSWFIKASGTSPEQAKEWLDLYNPAPA